MMTLSSTPSARPTDPDTSHSAGERALTRAPIVRAVILELMDGTEPLTHDEIIARYRMRMITHPDTPKASDSGIRTRVSELCRAGLLVQFRDEGRSALGNRAKLWVTPQWVARHSAQPPLVPDHREAPAEEITTPLTQSVPHAASPRTSSPRRVSTAAAMIDDEGFIPFTRV